MCAEYKSRTQAGKDGLLFPYSGSVLGLVAELLQMKWTYDAATDVGDAAPSAKTVQRYFAGQRVEPTTVEWCARATVRFILEGWRFGDDAVDAAARSLSLELAAWDGFAIARNAGGPRADTTEQMVRAIGRLAVLDAGTRLAAARHLLDVDPAELVAEPRALGRYLSMWRQRQSVTLEQLADDVGVSPQAAGAWCRGESIPHSDHLDALAGALRRSGAPDRVEVHLRLIAANDILRARVEELVGKATAEDWWETARKVAGHGHGVIGTAAEAAPAERIAEALVLTVLHGTKSSLGRLVATALAERFRANNVVRDDLIALAKGAAVARTDYWIAWFRDLDLVVEGSVDAESPWSVAGQARVARHFAEARVVMSGFDVDFPAGSMVFRVGGLEGQVRDFQRAESLGDPREIVEVARRFLQTEPQSAVAHFKLGAALWMQALAQRPVDRDMIAEAMHELDVAIALDPTLFNARNERAVLLSNMRQHQEAEEAFVAAELHCADFPHHWFTRGDNYLALKRYEDAARSFERCIAANAGERHVHAEIRLAAVYMHLKRFKKARDLGRRVAHVTGFDPSEDHLRHLDPWARVTPLDGVGRR